MGGRKRSLGGAATNGAGAGGSRWVKMAIGPVSDGSETTGGYVQWHWQAPPWQQP
ncbi:MAG: hypothetical protein ACREUG_08155 [Steroidobacteraceae bacterium]